MKSIVITTVFPPTPAVRDFSAERNWRLIVVGDRRTPEGWCCENAHFISASAQADCAPKLSAALPWNHYCRKMVGYVEAVRLDSECIVDTDDDNIPNSDWGFPDAEGFLKRPTRVQNSSMFTKHLRTGQSGLVDSRWSVFYGRSLSRCALDRGK
jgi:hypothetical protein